MLVKRNVPYWKDSEVLMAAVSLSAPPPFLHPLLLTLKALEFQRHFQFSSSAVSHNFLSAVQKYHNELFSFFC